MAWIKMKGNTFKPIDINSWTAYNISLDNYRYCGWTQNGTFLKAWGGGDTDTPDYNARVNFKSPTFSKLKGKVIHTKLTFGTVRGYIYGDLIRVRDGAVVVQYFFNTYTGKTTPSNIIIPDDDEYMVNIFIYAHGAGGTYYPAEVTVNSMYIDKK